MKKVHFDVIRFVGSGLHNGMRNWMPEYPTIVWVDLRLLLYEKLHHVGGPIELALETNAGE